MSARFKLFPNTDQPNIFDSVEDAVILYLPNPCGYGATQESLHIAMLVTDFLNHLDDATLTPKYPKRKKRMAIKVPDVFETLVDFEK